MKKKYFSILLVICMIVQICVLPVGLVGEKISANILVSVSATAAPGGVCNPSMTPKPTPLPGECVYFENFSENEAWYELADAGWVATGEAEYGWMRDGYISIFYPKGGQIYVTFEPIPFVSENYGPQAKIVAEYKVNYGAYNAAVSSWGYLGFADIDTYLGSNLGNNPGGIAVGAGINPEYDNDLWLYKTSFADSDTSTDDVICPIGYYTCTIVYEIQLTDDQGNAITPMVDVYVDGSHVLQDKALLDDSISQINSLVMGSDVGPEYFGLEHIKVKLDEGFSDNPAPTPELIASGECVNGVEWTFDSNGVLTIKGEGKIPGVAPELSEWQDYTGRIKSVVIEDGITEIGAFVFYNSNNLEEITIADSVTKIEAYAFSNCPKLTEFTIGENVTQIDRFAFSPYLETEASQFECIIVDSENANYVSQDGVLYNKDKTEIVIYPAGKKDAEFVVPDGVKSIKGAFYKNVNLKKLTISKTVEKELEVCAFMGCDGLEEIIVDSENQYYTSQDGVLFNTDKTKLIRYPSAKEGSAYVVESEIINIENGAFRDALSLKEIEIPLSVEVIGVYAFDGCEALETVKYAGTADEWNEIEVDAYNKPLINADIIASYTETLKGDVNGDGEITATDVTNLMQIIAGWGAAEVTDACDVNGDGEVDATDITTLMQIAAGWN